MTKGYEWAQAQYDRQEPFLPVCEGCGRTVDAVADIDGTRLCEACVSERYFSKTERFAVENALIARAKQ